MPHPSKARYSSQCDARELAGYRELFDSFDRDQSGSVSSTELGLLVRAYGGKPSESQVQTLVMSTDLDGSGLVEFEEFVGLMLRFKRLASEVASHDVVFSPLRRLVERARSMDESMDDFWLEGVRLGAGSHEALLGLVDALWTHPTIQVLGLRNCGVGEKITYRGICFKQGPPSYVTCHVSDVTRLAL